MRKSWSNILIICFLFLILVAIRYFEHLFYDPLQTYFGQAYLHTKLPDINTPKLLLNILLRYTLNGLVSIFIIWIAFRRKSYLSFSIYFYVLAFILMLLAFIFVLQTKFENYYLFGFYVRRFLIHPIFVLILLPAFYYQFKKTSN